HAGLSGDDDDLPATLQGVVESGLEPSPLHFATDHRHGCPGEARGRGAAYLGHRSHELIPTPWKCLDERRPVRSIAEDLPDFQDVLLDDFRIDVSVRPEGLQDLLVCYQAIRVLDQIAEHVERLRRQRHTLVAAPQTLVDRVKTKRVEVLHRSLTRA